ncbi:MAG: ABC transporter ATP-binding protein [Erysipelotrichaceae bacterium]|nr:ABC transporter ATP-binding protein [Erysipelotrichaceae bacterium]
METILKVKNLCKENILNNVSFEMYKGEMLAIMGPSGSGKSTLLYNISGMDNPDSGTVILADKEVNKMSEDEKADFRLREIGFVFQQMNMISRLNIIDNILLPAIEANKNKDIKVFISRANNLMKKLSIDGLQKRRINEVSGGQLQRACICRSLINDPKILFCDEPTGALNKSASNEVIETLLSINKEGSSILMVTHDSRMASRCGRILYLVDGKITGELKMDNNVSLKEKEESVNEWLSKMEW